MNLSEDGSEEVGGTEGVESEGGGGKQIAVENEASVGVGDGGAGAGMVEDLFEIWF